MLKSITKIKYPLALFVTSLIWGVAFVAQKEGSKYLSPFTFNGARFLLGALSLLPLIFIIERQKASAKEWSDTLKYGIIAGIVLFCAATLQQYGVVITNSAAKSGFITGLYTVFVPIAGMFLGLSTGLFTWLGAGLAVGGLWFLCAPNGIGDIGTGDFILLVGAIFWAAHIIVVDKFAVRIRPLRFSVVQFLTCALLSLIGMFIFEFDVRTTFTGLQNGLVPLLYAGLLSVGVAYTLQIIGQRGTPPAQAAIIFSLEAFWSAIGELVILGVALSTKSYAGCALMLAGIILAQIKTHPKKAKN
jgi:drug/metabolite transporter (DMT)-like permease